MYKLYQEMPQKQSDTQKKKNDPLNYLVVHVDDCETKMQADYWVSSKCDVRSWSKS